MRRSITCIPRCLGLSISCLDLVPSSAEEDDKLLHSVTTAVTRGGKEGEGRKEHKRSTANRLWIYSFPSFPSSHTESSLGHVVLLSLMSHPLRARVKCFMSVYP